jgi:hypothetical protein
MHLFLLWDSDDINVQTFVLEPRDFPLFFLSIFSLLCSFSNFYCSVFKFPYSWFFFLSSQFFYLAHAVSVLFWLLYFFSSKITNWLLCFLFLCWVFLFSHFVSNMFIITPCNIFTMPTLKFSLILARASSWCWYLLSVLIQIEIFLIILVLWVDFSCTFLYFIFWVSCYETLTTLNSCALTSQANKPAAFC